MKLRFPLQPLDAVVHKGEQIVLVLDQGRLLYDGDFQGFQRKFARERSVRTTSAFSRRPTTRASAP